MVLSHRQPRPSKAGLAIPPAPTLSRYVASVPSRRPPIVTLFDQVGAVVSVARGRDQHLGRHVLQALPSCGRCANATRDLWSEERARSLWTVLLREGLQVNWIVCFGRKDEYDRVIQYESVL